MRSRSRPNHTKEASGPNGPQAERAAVEAEEALRLAAARSAERDAASLESLAAEIEERERALEAREALIRALENRLEDSRRRLEERIEEMRERRPVTTGVYLSGPAFNVPSIDEGYFDAGSNADEDAWWSRQLGKPPRLAA